MNAEEIAKEIKHKMSGPYVLYDRRVACGPQGEYYAGIEILGGGDPKNPQIAWEATPRGATVGERQREADAIMEALKEAI